MNAAFRTMLTPRDADGALDASRDHAVVIYKHSPTCEISADAMNEMHLFLAQAPEGLDIRIVDVLSARPASLHIEARTGVRHESPQVLLLVKGEVAWHASHRRITAGALSAALSAA